MPLSLTVPSVMDGLMDEEESRMVGNYMLVEVIGEGSFSEVSVRWMLLRAHPSHQKKVEIESHACRAERCTRESTRRRRSGWP